MSETSDLISGTKDFNLVLTAVQAVYTPSLIEIVVDPEAISPTASLSDLKK